jgi:hypothetical protein
LAAAAVADSRASFDCVVSNLRATIQTTAAVLTVIPTVAPVITVQPNSQTVDAGSAVVFSVTATGTPTPTYQWRRNDVPISGATSASYRLPAAALADSNVRFVCQVRNSKGVVTSTPAILTVSQVAAPVIVSQPQSQTVDDGSPVTFTVTATGTPTPTYQWRRNDVPISGATSASYRISAVSLADSQASFTCQVSNRVGRIISSAATLTVTSLLPRIVVQPQPLIAASVGDRVSFSITVASATPVSYRWQVRRVEADGTVGWADLIGAQAATYTLPPLTIENNGAIYSCLVGNTVGKVGSERVRLQVAQAGLPPGWTSSTIGGAERVPAATFVNGAWTVAGSGRTTADIWGKADEFQMVWRPITGDVRITARVASVTDVHFWAKAVVMFRQSESPDSPHAMMIISPGRGASFQQRLVAGGLSQHTTLAAIRAPYWVRLDRVGAEVIGSISADGQGWQEVRRQAIDLGAQIRVGLVVSSHVPGVTATGVIDQVQITAVPPAAN